MLASKLLDLPAHLYVYNAHVVVHDCSVIIIHVHVHVSGPVDSSKRHIFQLLISLAYWIFSSFQLQYENKVHIDIEQEKSLILICMLYYTKYGFTYIRMGLRL